MDLAAGLGLERSQIALGGKTSTCVKTYRTITAQKSKSTAPLFHTMLSKAALGRPKTALPLLIPIGR